MATRSIRAARDIKVESPRTITSGLMEMARAEQAAPLVTVTSLLASLGAETDRLKTSLSDLFCALEPVMNACPPDNSGEDEMTSVLPPALQALREQVWQINNLRQAVEAIHLRLVIS